MKVAIVSIGDELMNGFTVNSNASWIAKKINSFSRLDIAEILTLYDDVDEIENKVKNLLNNNYAFIFLTGGLGPTHDDVTKKALKKIFNSKIVLNKHYYGRLLKFFKKRGYTNIAHLRDQAEILDCSTPIPNKHGTALGMYIKSDDTKIFILPGVPNEMKSMLQDEIIPNFIELKFKKKINQITYLTTGITESRLSDQLSDIIESNKNKFKVSFLPSYFGVKVRICPASNNEKKEDFNDICAAIMTEIDKFCYGLDDDRMEEVVCNLLIKNQFSISLAESCTGGLMSKKITDIPGSSACYNGSIIAYSNIVKEKQLLVPKAVLKTHGAVSPEVALIMAENIKKIFDSDIGLSITGISGPEGGADSKPVGLVYIAIIFKDKKIVKEFNLINNRKLHREISTHIGFNMLRLLLK